MRKMRKKEILNEVAKIGTSIARQADPGYYSAENHCYAKAYVPKLEAMREAYRKINKGGNAIDALLEAREVIATGGEWNFLSRLIEKIKKARQ